MSPELVILSSGKCKGKQITSSLETRPGPEKCKDKIADSYK